MDEGCLCVPVEPLLNHLVDGTGEYIVVDMTAEADSFASGQFTKFDLTFLVAEPTLKAVSVYRQYTTHARGYDVKIRVLGNKVESAEDVTFLLERQWAMIVAMPTVRMMQMACDQIIRMIAVRNGFLPLVVAGTVHRSTACRIE